MAATPTGRNSTPQQHPTTLPSASAVSQQAQYPAQQNTYPYGQQPYAQQQPVQPIPYPTVYAPPHQNAPQTPATTANNPHRKSPAIRRGPAADIAALRTARHNRHSRVSLTPLPGTWAIRHSNNHTHQTATTNRRVMGRNRSLSSDSAAITATTALRQSAAAKWCSGHYQKLHRSTFKSLASPSCASPRRCTRFANWSGVTMSSRFKSCVRRPTRSCRDSSPS